MKDNRKRIKLSILVQVGLLYLAALILATILGMALNRNYILNDSAKQGEDIAKVVAVSAEIAIGAEENIDDLMRDEQFREKVHKRFRYICEKSDVRYLYLYKVDDEGHKHYIVCAAEDDEEDRLLNEEFGFGTENDRPLYDAEIAVLNGKLDGEYQFVNNEYGNVCMFILPVIVNDRIVALIGVDYRSESIIEIEHKNMINLLIQAMIIMGLAYVTTMLLIRQSVIRPILSLSGRMRNFIKNREDHVTANERTPLIENEITDIEKSFDKMAEDISGYVEDIRTLAGEKAQSEAQLDIAKKIQLGLVPQEHSHAGEGYEAYGCERPARAVGGDFYEIFSPDEDHICVIVGDISGKGIYAALFMIMVRTAIIEMINGGISLSDTLKRINNDICMRNPENMFATVFALLLNTKTGLLTFANAGHESPLLLRGETEYLKMDHGMALGLFADSKIITEELRLNVGEGILVYTDGVTETINKDKVQYGREGLKKTVDKAYAEGGSYSTDKVVQSVAGSLEEYAEGLQQFDDITCVALVYNENGEKGLSPDIRSFKAVKQAMLSSLGDNEDSRCMILACEEIFSNIVNYSGADNVSFACKRMGQIYSVTFTDNGTPFDPTEAKIREKDFEDLDTGGMGIKLARMYSNDMVYIRAKNMNILTLKFELRE